MNAGLIASRYADALVKFAGEDSAKVYADVISLQNALSDQQTLSKAVEASCTKTREFLKLVISNGRADILPLILNSFVQRYREKEGIVLARLTCASESSSVEGKLAELLALDGIRQAEFTTSVDSDLLGGFVLQVGDSRIDASLRTQLETLRKEFESQNNII